MAGKNIAIDLEAYRLLKVDKRDRETFSDVIKRRFAPAPTARTARTLLENLDRVVLAEDTLDRIEELIRARRASL